MIFFYFLVGIMPLTDHPIWARFVGEFTVFKYIGATCVLYAIVRMAARRAIPFYFRSWQARFLVVFYLIATVSYFTKNSQGALELSPFLSYTAFVLLFFVTLTVVDSPSRLRWVLLVAIGSVAFASLYVVREWQKYHELYAGFRPPGWVVGDINYFTISALLTLPIASYVTTGSKQLWERLFCAGCLAMTLVAVTLGASRGGFLGLLAAFFVVVWNSRDRSRNLVFCALVLPLLFILPVLPVQRLLHPTNSDTGNAASRVAVWQSGLRMIVAHPILGIGLGNFKLMVPQYSVVENTPALIAHNAYIEIGAEMGLPALLIFLGILYFSFRTLNLVRVHTVRAGPPLVWQAASSLQAGLVGSSVALFFVSGQYQKLFWLILFLSACLPSFQLNSKRSVAGLDNMSVQGG